LVLSHASPSKPPLTAGYKIYYTHSDYTTFTSECQTLDVMLGVEWLFKHNSGYLDITMVIQTQQHPHNQAFVHVLILHIIHGENRDFCINTEITCPDFPPHIHPSMLVFSNHMFSYHCLVKFNRLSVLLCWAIISRKYIRSIIIYLTCD